MFMWVRSDFKGDSSDIGAHIEHMGLLLANKYEF